MNRLGPIFMIVIKYFSHENREIDTNTDILIHFCDYLGT